MRLVLLITDSEALPAFERGFVESGDRGFTVAPRVHGRGRSGMHAGDRVHPGGSSLLFSVVEDHDLPATLDFVKGIRDRGGWTATTKIYVLPAEEVR